MSSIAVCLRAQATSPASGGAWAPAAGAGEGVRSPRVGCKGTKKARKSGTFNRKIIKKQIKGD